jgi:hypothetical protein
LLCPSTIAIADPPSWKAVLSTRGGRGITRALPSSPTWAAPCGADHPVASTPHRAYCALPLVLLLSAQLAAQDRFFSRPRVDFWGENRPDPQPTTPTEDLWTEHQVARDGRVSAYRPPQVLLDLLEEPSDENARRYLQWQQLRVRKILHAQRALDRVKTSSLPEHPQPAANPSPTPRTLPLDPSQSDSRERILKTIDWSDLEIAYFYMPQCPACVKQDAEWTRILAAYPEIFSRLSRIDVSNKPETAQAFAIRATPTTILKKRDEARLERLEGIITADRLIDAAHRFVKERP